LQDNSPKAKEKRRRKKKRKEKGDKRNLVELKRDKSTLSLGSEEKSYDA